MFDGPAEDILFQLVDISEGLLFRDDLVGFLVVDMLECILVILGDSYCHRAKTLVCLGDDDGVVGGCGFQ